VPEGMGVLRRWRERPQRLRLRRALFQVHLWTGIVAGLYVVAVSVSGSALVFRREMDRGEHPSFIAANGRTMLSAEEIERRAQRAYRPGEILGVLAPQRPGRPYSVVFATGSTRVERFFDPYTGADLGDPRPLGDRVLYFLADLHDNLLSGLTGRILNGLGALLLVLMSLTGAVLWWPGIKNWRRSTRVKWRARPARLNWDLHSAIGFWGYLFVLVWGVSGVQLCFPGTLDPLVGSEVRYWLTALHFGRFNVVTEAIWTVAGLVPAILAVTGVLMWWNRVLVKKIKRAREQKGDPALVG
jgi:uncharacterized iron-regulated membrane protein